MKQELIENIKELIKINPNDTIEINPNYLDEIYQKTKKDEL